MGKQGKQGLGTAEGCLGNKVRGSRLYEDLCPAHSRCSVKHSMILGVMVHNVGAPMSLRLSWSIQ